VQTKEGDGDEFAIRPRGSQESLPEKKEVKGSHNIKR